MEIKDTTLNDAIVDSINHHLQELDKLANDTSKSELNMNLSKLIKDYIVKIAKPRLNCPHKDWFFDPCYEDCNTCKALRESYPNIDFSKLTLTRDNIYYD